MNSKARRSGYTICGWASVERQFQTNLLCLLWWKGRLAQNHTCTLDIPIYLFVWSVHLLSYRRPRASELALLIGCLRVWRLLEIPVKIGLQVDEKFDGDYC